MSRGCTSVKPVEEFFDMSLCSVSKGSEPLECHVQHLGQVIVFGILPPGGSVVVFAGLIESFNEDSVVFDDLLDVFPGSEDPLIGELVVDGEVEERLELWTEVTGALDELLGSVLAPECVLHLGHLFGHD